MGKSQFAVARAAGISRATLVRFENGDGAPSLAALVRIATVLECEAQIRDLFPSPDVRSIEDLLERKPPQRATRSR